LQTKNPFRQLTLDNGLEIIIHDLTRAYFGDYNLVRLEIICQFQRTSPAKVDGKAAGLFVPAESEALYRRVLEKMGVPSSLVAQSKEALIDDFLQNSLPYLSDPQFPAKLSSARLAGTKKTPLRYSERKP